MVLSKQSLTIAKAGYWLLTIGVHGFICYKLFTMSKALAGLLWLFVGFLLIYVMYGVFFNTSDANSSWPPYLTSCPDYLTRLSPTACVDYVGLGSSLLKSDPTNPPDPTDPKYVFNPTGTLQQKAQNAQSLGLTWEGVT